MVAPSLAILPLALLVASLGQPAPDIVPPPPPAHADAITDDNLITLDNGMRCLIVPDDAAPGRIGVAWVADVSLADAQPGMTGARAMIAELLQYETRTPLDPTETERITRQNELQEQIRSAIRARQIDRWRRGDILTPWNPAEFDEDAAAAWTALEPLIAATEAQPGAPFIHEVLETLGSDVIVEVAPDAVVCAAVIPAGRLDEWADLEAARLDEPAFRRFDRVRIERLRGPVDAITAATEQLTSAFWRSSPAAAPLRGQPMDLALMTRPRLQAFYRTHFAPDQLTAVVVGDVEATAAAAVLNERLGAIPARSPAAPPERTPWETWQMAEVRLDLAGPQPIARMLYHAPPHGHPDEGPAHVLAALIDAMLETSSPTTGDEPIVVTAQQAGLDHSGQFGVNIQASSNDDLDAALEHFETIRNELGRSPILDERFVAARAWAVQQRAASDRSRVGARAHGLALDLARGGPAEAGQLAARIAAVTPADVMRLAQIYLRPANRAILVIRAPEGEDAALALMSPALQAQVRALLQRIEAITDPNVLTPLADQFRTQAANTTPELAAALRFLIERIDARRNELEAAGGEDTGTQDTGTQDTGTPDAGAEDPEKEDATPER